MGLVGLPNVGKSTTFNFLCNQSVRSENFPFCTIDPNEARMSVPDDRFKWLCDHFKPKSHVSATLSMYDIAGLVPGAHQGNGLGNAFLSHIQAVDGIYHVVRAFEYEDTIVHTEGQVNPVNDLETISSELRLKDVSHCQNIIQDIERKTQRMAKDKRLLDTKEVLTNVLQQLQSGKWIIDVPDWKLNEIEILNEFQFLTSKPVVYLINMSEHDFIKQKNKWLSKINTWVSNNVKGPIIPYSAEFESKLAKFQTEEEKLKFIKDSGATKSMVNKIINIGYSTLNLIHFFTCGEDEVKCWTIRANTKAPQAAGVIHTDFEKGFICAEVYKFSDLYRLGSEAEVKAAGEYHQKGKDYVVEDGDIIFFKFNVTTRK